MAPQGSLASGSLVSLLPRREDSQIPLCVSCQDFFWMCQTTLLVFAGGAGLYLYYIVISGRVALPCLIFPLFFFLIFIAWNPGTLRGRGKADKHPSNCPGKGSGDWSGFPGEGPLLYGHGGRTGSSGEGLGQLWASHIHDLYATRMLLGLFSGPAWPSNSLEARNSEKWVLGQSGAGDSPECWLP